MNSGIYALYWWEQDLVYVGLSQNLSNRKKEHFTLLKNNKHTNYKVQSAYNNYGEPDFIVLEYTEDIAKLPELEVYWCKELGALDKHGLCLVEPGVVGFGMHSNASKYSKIKILKCFSLLYKGKLSVPQISVRIHVPVHTIHDIAYGRTHVWLQNVYKEKYLIMLSHNRKEISNNSILQGRVLDTSTNKVHDLYNIKRFCIEMWGTDTHSSGVCRVLKGTRSKYKNIVLFKE